jgi:hypothetical protein
VSSVRIGELSVRMISMSQWSYHDCWRYTLEKNSNSEMKIQKMKSSQLLWLKVQQLVPKRDVTS